MHGTCVVVVMLRLDTLMVGKELAAEEMSWYDSCCDW